MQTEEKSSVVQVRALTEEAWRQSKRELVKIVPVQADCGGFIIESTGSDIPQHPIRGRFMAQTDCEDAIADWIDAAFSYSIYLEDRQKYADLLLKRSRMKGLKYLTTEPNYWLNRCPDNWECSGRDNTGTGQTVLYLVGSGDPPDWEEDVYVGGEYRNSKPVESEEALVRWGATNLIPFATKGPEKLSNRELPWFMLQGRDWQGRDC